MNQLREEEDEIPSSGRLQEGSLKSSWNMSLSFVFVPSSVLLPGMPLDLEVKGHTLGMAD